MADSALTIVHVVFSSRIAGGEKHCMDLAQAQSALGHDVHIVGTGGSAIEAALPQGVSFHGLTLPFLFPASRLRRLLRRLGADVCHGHLGPACKAVAKVPSVARIATLHVGYKPHHHAKLDGLICVNEAQRLTIRGARGRVVVIHNWAPERAQDSKDCLAVDLHKELVLERCQYIVGAVGRLHPTKGMDVLIEAFIRFAPANAVLVIVGDGPERRHLEHLASGDARIRLLGFRDDVDAVLQGMDLYVSASREEAFSLAMLEAMRAGLPIVSTDTLGANEMLRGQPAQLVPVGEADLLGQAMRDQIKQLATQPASLSRSQVYDMSRFQRDQAVDRALTLYRQVLAQMGQLQALSVASDEEEESLLRLP